MRISSVALLSALSVAGVQMAAAADLPAKAPVFKAPASIPYSWTGFYVGGQIGGGWSATQATLVTGDAFFPAGTQLNTVNSSGVLGGVYAGYNYQIDQIVVGIDGDYSWAGLSGSSTTALATGTSVNVSSKVKWVATLTGRLGYAFERNWLLFAKGGAAWAGYSGESAAFGTAGANVGNGTNSQTRNGWTIGAGAEWGFAAHWSAKLEYDYVKFSTANFNSTETSVPAGIVTTPARSATSSLSMAKLGLAYRF